MKKRILACLAAFVFLMTGCGKVDETTTTIDEDKAKVTEDASDAASDAAAEETEAPAETVTPTETVTPAETVPVEEVTTEENGEVTDKEAETEEPDATVTEAEKPDDQNVSDADIDAAVAENTVIIELYPDIAPITCDNFISLVNDKFYDGLTFHRVIDDFMAQGGDPAGNGTGGSKNTIKGEFSGNGVNNTLSHTRGVISMARSNDKDSASSQFFICYSDDCTFLDGQYAAFGKVESGMEVVDNFLKVKRTGREGGTPVSEIKMKEVTMIGPDEDGHPRVQIVMEDFLK